ncbi:MAG TPA: OmpH family outer membrane protein [Saprospiraceae bacterium]|nr:OmpH family outer membrane protein [Saprospiraceae bacterium]
MRKTFQMGGIVLLLLMAAINVQAQKFGYINTAEILAEMPEVKQAEVDIENFSSALEKKGQAKVQELQQKYAKIQEQMQAGNLSPVQQQQAQTDLQKDQEELAQFEQDMMGQIQDKRQKALQPIYDKLNNAIEQVAKENGFTMIFDKAVLLYSEDSADVSAMVKAKLGL